MRIFIHEYKDNKWSWWPTGCSWFSASNLQNLFGFLFYIKLWFFFHPHRFSNQLISVLASLTVRVLGLPPQSEPSPPLVVQLVQLVLQVWRVWGMLLPALRCSPSAALAAVSSQRQSQSQTRSDSRFASHGSGKTTVSSFISASFLLTRWLLG